METEAISLEEMIEYARRDKDRLVQDIVDIEYVERDRVGFILYIFLNNIARCNRFSLLTRLL